MQLDGRWFMEKEIARDSLTFEYQGKLDDIGIVSDQVSDLESFTRIRGRERGRIAPARALSRGENCVGSTYSYSNEVIVRLCMRGVG